MALPRVEAQLPPVKIEPPESRAESLAELARMAVDQGRAREPRVAHSSEQHMPALEGLPQPVLACVLDYLPDEDLLKVLQTGNELARQAVYEQLLFTDPLFPEQIKATGGRRARHQPLLPDRGAQRAIACQGFEAALKIAERSRQLDRNKPCGARIILYRINGKPQIPERLRKFQCLPGPQWTPQKSGGWVLSAIMQGLPVILWTRPVPEHLERRIPYSRNELRATIFAREITELVRAGYSMERYTGWELCQLKNTPKTMYFLTAPPGSGQQRSRLSPSVWRQDFPEFEIESSCGVSFQSSHREIVSNLQLSMRLLDAGMPSVSLQPSAPLPLGLQQLMASFDPRPASERPRAQEVPTFDPPMPPLVPPPRSPFLPLRMSPLGPARIPPLVPLSEGSENISASFLNRRQLPAESEFEALGSLPRAQRKDAVAVPPGAPGAQAAPGKRASPGAVGTVKQARAAEDNLPASKVRGVQGHTASSHPVAQRLVLQPR